MKKIISAAMTPFTDDNRVDLDSAARLYEFGISCGLDGFFLPGTMGEWALMTQSERSELAKTACDVIGKRARVLLSISDLGKAAILENAQRWSGLSHDAWVIVLPWGLGAPADPVAYLHDIAGNVDRAHDGSVRRSAGPSQHSGPQELGRRDKDPQGASVP